jgi:hypothetical protein
MRILAIGLCATIVFGGCSKTGDNFKRFTFTPPPRAPASSTPARRVNLRLHTLKGDTVTTAVSLPPNIGVGANGAVLQPKVLWRVAAPPSPPPSEYVAPELRAVDDSIFVSAGSNVERIEARTGRILWRSQHAEPPFTVSSGLIYTAQANVAVALKESDGHLLWRRAICPVSTRVAAVAADGRTFFGLCADPAKLVAQSAQTGSVLYTRILSNSDRGTSLQVLGSGALLAGGFFEGAWMGDNFYVVRERTGDVVLKRTNIAVLRIRRRIADFNDRCCFEHNDAYEPAKILPVNLLTGDMGEETTLAPEPARFKSPDGGGSYGPDGTLFSNGNDIYLFYGDTLFRYANLHAAPIELLRGIELVVNAHAGAFVAVLDGDPDSVLARIDWTAKHAVLHPVAAIESAWPHQQAIHPAPIGTEVLDGVQLGILGDGTIARFPIGCRPSTAWPETKTQLLAAICESPSRVGYVEALSVP